MSWNYAYTPAVWPTFLTTLLLIGLVVYSWRRRSMPGALPFSIGCLFVALWAFGSLMEVIAVGVQDKILWFKFQAVWQLPAATAITCFVLEYAWPGRWLTRRNIILLSIPCLLALVLILTGDLHHLIWRGFDVENTVVPLRTPGSWGLVTYAYGLAVFNIGIFIWLFIRSPQHRWPAVIMIAGLVVGRLLHLLDSTAAFHADLPYNLPPVAFEYMIYAIALFGFRIFDPIPLARQAVINQMHEGMLVLDLHERVVSLNAAAVRILDSSTSRLKGQLIGELLPSYTISSLTDEQDTEIELGLRSGSELRYYNLAISPLKDWRGLEAGRLLLLHDVTAQKLAQVRLLEQERALAILHEREQLARELHDSTGQVLGYVKLQAMAARDMLARDQISAVDSNLAQLIEVAQEAHDEVREYILGAKIATQFQYGFLPTLCKYLEAFTEHYKLPTELSAPTDWNDNLLEPTAEAQLLRIIQEALTNARKHSQAHNVLVQLNYTDSRVQAVIRDDGIGFDLSLLVDSKGLKYGLGFMRQRAEEAGGTLEIESAPGKGTRVVVEVPVRQVIGKL